jgi:hypothetical protein
MDFHPTERQIQLRHKLAGLLAANPAPEGFDTQLLAGLEREGLIKPLDSGDDILDATFVVEDISRAGRLAPVGIHALLLPSVLPEREGAVAAIARAGSQVPVRFAQQANLLFLVDESETSLHRVEPGTAVPVVSNCGYPLAIPPAQRGPSLCVCASELVARRWQLAIAAEAVGAMDSVLSRMVDYLSGRHQFGKPLASFQALQHRLAELATTLECARLLLREAAWYDDAERAADAACYATAAARQFCLEGHQLCGARGFTLEFDMQRDSLRLHALSLEGGGCGWHSEVAAQERWRRQASPPPQSHPGVSL